MEWGRMQGGYEATDLAEFTIDLASTFRSAIERGKLSLIVDCPPLPEPVFVDREMWEKIVLNLLSNAFKHTFEGSIRVALQWRGDSVELRVTDTGIGIREAELPRVFERFRSINGAQALSDEGTGIGRALVQERVLAHGGTIQEKREEGRESTTTATIKAGPLIRGPRVSPPLPT